MPAPSPVQVQLVYQVVPVGPVSFEQLQAAVSSVVLYTDDLKQIGAILTSDVTTTVFVPGLGTVVQRTLTFSLLPLFVQSTPPAVIPAGQAPGTASGSFVSSSPQDALGGTGCSRLKINFIAQDGTPSYAFVVPTGTTPVNLTEQKQIVTIVSIEPVEGSPAGLFYLFSGLNGTGLLLAEGTGPLLGPALQNFQGSILSSSPADNAAQTVIAVDSNAQFLPQEIVNVASTAGFPSSGIAYVSTTTGVQAVTYTGITATQLIGCSGGTGQMATGGLVAAGVGAMVVQISYNDSTGAPQPPELVTLNGTTPVNLPNLNHAVITDIELVDVGATGSSAGIISIMTGIGGTGGLAGYLNPSFFQYFPQQTVVSAAIVPPGLYGQTVVLPVGPVAGGTAYVQAGTGIAGTPTNVAPGSPPNAIPSTATRTTITPPSDGVALPQPVINVASTDGFADGGGVIIVTTSDGLQFVTYKATTGTTFTGCTGGTGVMSTGGLVKATNIIAADIAAPFRGKYTQTLGAGVVSKVIELDPAFS